MLEVTPDALRRLKGIAEECALEPGKLLRLAVPPVWTGEGDWGIVIDQRGAADAAYAHEGATVLVVEDEVARSLANAVLDFKAEGWFSLDVY